MSARDPSLRVIECVQAIVHCPSVLAEDAGCNVPFRLMADLQEAYQGWLESKKVTWYIPADAIPSCDIGQWRKAEGGGL